MRARRLCLLASGIQILVAPSPSSILVKFKFLSTELELYRAEFECKLSITLPRKSQTKNSGTPRLSRTMMMISPRHDKKSVCVIWTQTVPALPDQMINIFQL